MPTPRAAEQTSRHRLSTAQTLSLLTVGVVVAVLTTAMAVVWFTLTSSAVEVAQDRVDRSVRQLVAAGVSGLRQTATRYLGVAHDPAVVGFLRDSQLPLAPRLVAVRASLAQLQTPADSGLPVELWNASGKRVAFVGDDVSEPLTLQIRSETSEPPSVRHLGIGPLRRGDSVSLGALYRAGNRTYYWIVAPVLHDGHVLGFLAQQRRIATNPQTARTIRELSGNSAAGYYHNSDGSVWTTFGGFPALPPDTVLRRGARVRPGVGSVLYADENLPGTPFGIVMEMPHDAVVASAREIVRRLALFSGGLTVLAVILAWLAGRRVARPLAELTSAAESVARGDYSTRVPTRGSIEVSRLAVGFNRMATEVGESRAMLESREAELRTLANTIPQLAWMAHTDGSPFWFNDRWYEYTGQGADQPCDTLWLAAHDSEMLSEVCRRWESSLKTGALFEMEVRLRRKDGTFRWFLSRAAPVHGRTGPVTRWFGTSTDIQALREARDAAEAGNRAKSDFLAAMSHELRTPLNAIGGYAELIEMGLRGPISEEQRRDLGRIRASQAHLLGLIGRVLDLSRIENGRVTYEMRSIALDPILTGLQELILPQAAAKQQVLEYRAGQPDLVALADREKLRQIILNLLSNAVRHSPVGASITITASRRSPDTVAIFVHDSGPGIPADRRESIFEPFVQLDRSLTSATQGVGLGLAISRDLARGMGGDLTVSGLPGQGACFTLTLPIGILDERTQMTRTSETQALRLGR